MNMDNGSARGSRSGSGFGSEHIGQAKPSYPKGPNPEETPPGNTVTVPEVISLDF
jgi:hypothetical protein